MPIRIPIVEYDQEVTPFPCSKCGLCCQNVDVNILYHDLDRGDGVCYYYEEGSKECSIYNDRPDICNITTMFNTYFSHMSWVEFVKLNQSVCEDMIQDTFFNNKDKG